MKRKSLASKLGWISRSKFDVDSNWYFLEYPDVAASGMSAERHYRDYGFKEGRHPKFDGKWYLEEYEDVARAGIDPLEHYLHHGRHEGRHPAFNPTWYLLEYDDVRESGMNPQKHYRNYGKQEGRHPAFDRRFYSTSYPEIPAAGVDVYAHYLAHGRGEGRHPAFQRDWYLTEYPDVAAASIDPFKHFMLAGQREGRHASFDRRWYGKEYPDVPGYGMDLIEHYRRYGKYEGRYPAFHGMWYSNEYADVGPSGLEAHAHYQQIGKEQGRKPSPAYPGGVPYYAKLQPAGASYTSQYESDQNFSDYQTDVKAIAFYLPQFHESEHNNKFWGKGFTEWVNTKKSKPRFPGHYQPRVPHEDIGYYDLADPAVLAKQAAMAKEHGIHGFCFYHYWFSGERVLEKPVDLLLANTQIDINFMLCWANENWTRTWDGQEKDVLFAQDYSEDDPLQFIKDISPYLLDKRYIRIDNKPVLMVYKPHLVPNFEFAVKVWKSYWRDTHDVDLIVWVNRTDPADHSGRNTPQSVDGVVEFPPNHIPASRHPFPYLMNNALAYPGETLSGHIFDYPQMVDDLLNDHDLSPPPLDKPFYRSAILGWDNSARRNEGWSVWHGFSLPTYYRWLRKLVSDAQARLPEDQRFVFINAWNEWAEGTYLEPDQRFGYASINATSKALYGLPFDEVPAVIGGSEPLPLELKVAVHVHVYYETLTSEIFSYVANIPQPFDLFVTADSEAKIAIAKALVPGLRNVGNVIYHVVPNFGRDIAPLLHIGKNLQSYDVFAHLHTKRSVTVSWGDAWRKYLLDHLLGSQETVSGIFSRFKNDQKVGFFFPENYPLIAPHINWGGTKERCEVLLREIEAPLELPENPSFAAGSFFWARPKALKPILDRNWPTHAFEEEAGQVQATLAHCLERLWGYVAASQGFSSHSYLAKNAFKSAEPQAPKSKKRLSLFVHYSADDTFSAEDRFYLGELKKVSDKLVVIQNSSMPSKSSNRYEIDCDAFYLRWNRGYDFGAWRDALQKIGREEVGQYDEVVFANNSCYGPLYPMDDLLNRISDERDFWGATGFPQSASSPRPEALKLPDRTIPEHIQSYFFVVRKNLLRSNQFWDFWDSVLDNDNLTDVVAFQEVQMTRKFSEAGFTYDILVPESIELQAAYVADPRYNAPYNSPLAMLALGVPFIKKKAVGYAPQEAEATKELVSKLGLLPKSTLIY